MPGTPPGRSIPRQAGPVSGLDEAGAGAGRLRIAAPVRQGEVLGGAHLDEARDRAVELESLAALARRVEVLRLRVRRGDERHMGVVERVDEGDEAFGLVAVRL